jgi:hypothetical protein
MNCAMSGGYAEKKFEYEVGEKEQILFQLETKGICERGNYVIFPVQLGEFNLYTVKFHTSPVSNLFDSEDEAVEEFIKLTKGD